MSFPPRASYGTIGKQCFYIFHFLYFCILKEPKYFWMVFLNINLILVWLQTWVRNG
jgi:hypothetical protein